MGLSNVRKLMYFEKAEEYFRPQKIWFIKYGYKKIGLCRFFWNETDLHWGEIKKNLMPLWKPYKTTPFSDEDTFDFNSGKQRYKAIQSIIKQLKKELYGE
jgi:hypothetical protein